MSKNTINTKGFPMLLKKQFNSDPADELPTGQEVTKTKKPNFSL